MLHYQHLHLFQITNNYLERAIFQMFSGGVRKPIFSQMVNVGLSFNIIARFWHKILLFSKCIHLNFKISDNSSLCGTNFQNILKYITIQHGCLPHLQAPRGSRDPPTGDTETRNNIPDEARGPLLVQEFWPSKAICSPNPNSESYIY